ncbi:hypothetical protein [Kitasatospora sp. NPDC056731]|uniref:hypothetical protein n=1 Tax=Kitasatospora sp. NPDC056731 TaxID=3155422 RepID=UPI003442D2D5
MSATQHAATFSEFLQRPNATVAQLGSSSTRGLRLVRRGDEDLYLTTAAQAEQAVQVVDSTTRMFVAMMKSDPSAVGLLTRVFPDAFPWVRFLPEDDVRAFLVELIDTMRASTDLGILTPIATVIAAWKHTAEVHADPELYAQLTAPSHDDFGEVPEPIVDGK